MRSMRHILWTERARKGCARLLQSAAIVLCLPLIASCESPPVGSPFSAAFGLGDPRILIANSNAGTETISMHDTAGSFLGLLADYSLQNHDPQGLWPLTGTDFLVAINGTDMVERRNIFGEKVSDIIDSNFTGNIYGLTVRDQEVFVIETNTVESFYLNGTRIGNARINATIGSCVLNTPRGITVNSAGHILTVATGNDRINVYDVSNSSNTTCVSTNTTLGAIDPIAIIAHSNGKLYVATQGDDAIYEFAGDGTGSGTKIYQPGVATLNNPRPHCWKCQMALS